MTRLRIAVIGVGHLGKEHARILAGLPEVELVGVADVNAEQAHAVARRCGTSAYSDYRPLLNLVDAATIVVPTTNHTAIATEFLRRRIPVLVEKPLAADLEQAQTVVALAGQQKALLQVGHIERFNPAFEELQRHRLDPKIVTCERLGPFSGRSTDIGVVLDLMIHDLDLLLALAEAPVRSVEAVGVTIFGKHEDVANARLVFANGCVANVTASRASATPKRRMKVWSHDGYAEVDFARRHLTLVRSGVGEDAAPGSSTPERSPQTPQVRELDCTNSPDQLTRELQHFVHCVRTGARPRVGGEAARDAIALATQVLASLHAHPWTGRANGPIGPLQLPAPFGPLSRSTEGKAA
jgi:predicted dehydrogenase